MPKKQHEKRDPCLQALLDRNPTRWEDHFKQTLRDDPEYAKLWLEETVKEYSKTKDLNDLIYSVKPLIEANYTICDFAKKIGINRVTLYKIFSRKMTPSIEVLNKIFRGLGYELTFQVKKAS